MSTNPIVSYWDKWRKIQAEKQAALEAATAEAAKVNDVFITNRQLKHLNKAATRQQMFKLVTKNYPRAGRSFRRKYSQRLAAFALNRNITPLDALRQFDPTAA